MPLLKSAAASVDELDLVTDHVGEGGLHHRAREIRLIAGPVTEAGSEPVGRDALDAGTKVQPLERHFRKHVASTVRETEVVAVDHG